MLGVYFRGSIPEENRSQHGYYFTRFWVVRNFIELRSPEPLPYLSPVLIDVDPSKKLVFLSKAEEASGYCLCVESQSVGADFDYTFSIQEGNAEIPMIQSGKDGYGNKVYGMLLVTHSVKTTVIGKCPEYPDGSNMEINVEIRTKRERRERY